MMFLNFFFISTLFIFCHSYGVPSRVFQGGIRSDIWNFENRWKCDEINVRSSISGLDSKVVSAPKIAYYTRHGKQQAIIVCDEKSTQNLYTYAPNSYKKLDELNDWLVVSFGTGTGVIATCDVENEVYTVSNNENFVLGTVACISLKPKPSKKN